MNLKQQEDTHGWRFLPNASSMHYFTEDGRSLCGRWACLANNGYSPNDDGPGHCKKCERRLENKLVTV